jgi:hypothetical protein
VTAHHFEDLLRLGAVQVLVNFLRRGPVGHDAQIGRNNLASAVGLPQRRHKLCADLAQRSSHENSPHVASGCSHGPVLLA